MDIQHQLKGPSLLVKRKVSWEVMGSRPTQCLSNLTIWRKEKNVFVPILCENTCKNEVGIPPIQPLTCCLKNCTDFCCMVCIIIIYMASTNLPTKICITALANPFPKAKEASMCMCFSFLQVGSTLGATRDLEIKL